LAASYPTEWKDFRLFWLYPIKLNKDSLRKFNFLFLLSFTFLSISLNIYG
jgi:hypothetical protein